MKELNKYTVYVHTFPNGKKYVGVTCLPANARWCNGKGYDNHKKMSEAIKEFGWENVKHEIVSEKLTQTEASEKEKELIKELRTTEDDYGYNSSVGGVYNKKFAVEETKTEYINFKVDDGEREKLKKQAHKHEMNISEFLRWLIEKQRKEDEKNGELQGLHEL